MNENMIATCGVFDIIHADHINLFRKMRHCRKDITDVCIFLNSDKSVALNRGKAPLIPEKQRLEVLETICWIGQIHIFNEQRPHEMIRKYQPAVWAKGGDYDIESMQSTPIVREYGGEVITIPHKYGIHSSEIKHRCYDEVREDVMAGRRL